MRQIVIEIRYEIDERLSRMREYAPVRDVLKAQENALHQDIAASIFKTAPDLAAPHGARVQSVSVLWPQDVPS